MTRQVLGSNLNIHYTVQRLEEMCLNIIIAPLFIQGKAIESRLSFSMTP